MTLKQARANVNAETFGTEAWEAAMKIVRAIIAAIPPVDEEYCSVDSGVHRARLLNGRIV